VGISFRFAFSCIYIAYVPGKQTQICHDIILINVYSSSYYCCRYYLGPATVRMISENGPAFPLPLHLPPGHMVQQVLDENGVLTHVIMSQPGPPPLPHHHVVR